MASLVKLSISGIRSYDNRGRETLTFSKPLTLISGPNGVGKTTIIEALKYATTGDMPPNSRGGAFVHDPKMSGERQVLGQVKLGYINARGQHMVVTRSMQLTVARKNATFKTLDGQLLVVVDGKKETISSRCADLDTQVPLSLGVSTAVLNSVIFCHQEDSMWPLSEPSNVKKRFDDIFEATKYSKALDAIKSLRKDYTADLKLQQQSVDYLNQDNDRAGRVAAQIDALTVRIQNLTHETDATKREMDDTIAKLDRLFKQNQDFQKVISELVQARHSCQELHTHIATISADLEILEVPTSELEHKLERFADGEQQLQQDATRLSGQRAELLAQTEHTRADIEGMVRTQSSLEADQRAFERRSEQLEKIARDTTDRYNLPVSRDELEEFMQQKLLSMQTENKKALARTSQGLGKLQAELDQLRSDRASAKQKHTSSSEQVSQLDNQIKTLYSEVRKQRTDVSPKYHEELLNELLAKLEVALQNGSHPFKPQIEKCLETIAVVRRRVEASNQDLVTASSRFNENSRIMVQRDNLRKLTFYIQETSEQFEQAKRGITDEPIEQYMSERSQSLEKLEAQIATARDEIQTHRANESNAAAELDKMRGESSARSSRLRQAGVAASEFSQSLADAEEDLEIATQNLEQSSFTIQYYESARAQAKATSHCVLCHHEFGPSELDGFLKLITSKIASLPINKSDAADAFEATKRQAQALRELVGDFTALQGLHQRIPGIEQTLADAQASRASTQARIDELVSERDQCRADIASGKELERQSAEIARAKKEARELELACNSATMEQDFETPEQVQERLQAATAELVSAENKLKAAEKKAQQHKDEVGLLNSQISRTQLDLKNIELEEHAVRAKQAKISELEAEKSRIEGELPQMQLEVDRLDEAVSSRQLELSRAQDEAAQQRASLEAEQSSVSRAHETIRALQAEIADHDAGALDALSERLAQRRAKLEQTTQQIGELEQTIAQTERTLLDSRGEKRIIQDNLQLRAYREQAHNLERRIQELDASGAEAQKDRYESEARALQQSLSELSSNHSLRLGQCKSLEEQKQQLRGELAKDYDKIDQRYLEASTKLEYTRGATDDLGKYMQALDAAIMKYHSIKMQEINAVLDELWKGTYMGTDIDTIEIKSEIESTKTRSNHNYRVVMYKQGVELDMRGRCSAGQKLLASVLIRLALSECFGVASNFLVLDEPTTNLDVANIQALGSSLSRIIEARRKRNNFQLIVITHDEHFLSCLGASSFCDTFFRLYRDTHQHSRIDELPVTQLG